jgi:hypothetical protein
MMDKSGTANSLGIITDRFEVAAGCTYAASARLNLEYGGTMIYLRFFDGAGKQIADSAKSINAPLNEWTSLSVEGIAPQGAVRAEILLYIPVSTKAKVYYDDVSVQAKQTFQLPFEFGAPIRIGPATLTSNAGAAAIGNGEVYVAPSGSPAIFYALDAVTGEPKHAEPLPGSDVVWAMTIGSDGNVYFSGTNNGILYRYVPGEKKVENLGVNPSNHWVWDLDASQDGKIYGATYPDAKAFVYDIASGTFEDLGTMYPGQDYARGGGVTDKYYYVGIGTKAHLIRLDRETLEKREIDFPIAGQDNTVSNVWSYNGLLFVAYGTALAILDEATYEVKKVMPGPDGHTFDGMISPPSPFRPELIYFRNKNTSELWTYNTNTNEISPVEPAVKIENTVRSYKWITPHSGEKAGRTVLAIMQSPVSYSIFDPADHSVADIPLQITKQGTNVQSLEKGPDGKIYMGGYQSGMSIYDPETASFERQELGPAQIEGIGVLNGKVYFGIYGGALIYRYDPNQPYDPRANPALFYNIEDKQSRPFAFASGDNKLFIGTVGDYGQLSGALTIYDEAAGTWSVHRDVVKDQSVIGLAYKDGKLFGGTSIWGGLGIDPSAAEAKMFEWDVRQGVKTDEFELNVPGVQTPLMIGSLAFGPDGLLWGIVHGNNESGAPAFALFAMEPSTKTVVKSKLFPNGAKGSSWRPFYMKWSEDGLLYTTIGRYLVVFDPETLEYKQLVNGYVNLFTIADDGSIFYSTANDPYLVHLPVPLKEASLAAESTMLEKGTSVSLSVTGTLVNGKRSSMPGAAIEYFSSDPDIVSVQDGVMTAHQVGSAEVWAKVTWNGVTVETNKITVEVPVQLESVALSADRYSLKRTETVQLNISGRLNTGEAADLAGAEIEFFSSNPAVISPQSVTAAVYDPGTADVWVNVMWNGTVVQSNKITIAVETDADWIGRLIGMYEAEGQLQHPLAAQLKNNMEQAKNHKEEGRLEQAIKHLEDFLKHLQNEAMQKFVSPTAKQALLKDVHALIAIWTQEAFQPQS